MRGSGAGSDGSNDSPWKVCEELPPMRQICVIHKIE